MMYNSLVTRMTKAIKRQTEYEKSKQIDCIRRKSQPRNSLCDCGSGKKFKHCCGGIKND